MKLSGGAALKYFTAPEPGRAGLLIYGADAMRVALRRQEVIAALIGPEGEAEMRLTRIAGAEVRKDGSTVMDAMRAQGFFPGARVVFVEDATDASAPAISAALEEWAEGDAVLVVTAGQLAARSALRKAFEAHKNAYAVGLYDDPPSRDEIEAELKKSGLEVSQEAMGALNALARSMGPGDFRQTLEKVVLYKQGDSSPVTPEEIALMAPISQEADLDDVLNAVAEAEAGKLGPLLGRIEAQGVAPVTLCIGAVRHFRQLHAAAADPGGPSEGIARLRPPVFGPRRDRMVRQAQRWGMRRLEQALSILTDTDLTLRSSSQAPSMSVMERALIRLAMLARR